MKLILLILFLVLHKIRNQFGDNSKEEQDAINRKF